MQWVVERIWKRHGAANALLALAFYLLRDEHGTLLSLLLVVPWALTLHFYLRWNYSTELCLRLQERLTTTQKGLVNQTFSELRQTVERHAQAYASAEPDTVRRLVLDANSDFTIALSPLDAVAEDEDDTETRLKHE